ncbi:MAG TPA: pilus assembly protein [Anaerolineales bacterium]|nr:pilus assembly protein [Anaerolineales bacterium]HNQ93803.1 pilus assembly protein [Anaerolineales bacterium]HNS59739.1 pilus assembly protein [Anaerolineales bacterium]
MLFSPTEKGQGLVEYAIIIVLVAILVIVIVGALGEKTGGTFSSISNSLP